MLHNNVEQETVLLLHTPSNKCNAVRQFVIEASSTTILEFLKRRGIGQFSAPYVQYMDYQNFNFLHEAFDGHEMT